MTRPGTEGEMGMITKSVYDELVKYRDAPVSCYDGPSETVKYLRELEFIRDLESDVRPGLSIVTVSWAITQAGRDALSEFEEHTQEMAKQMREKKKDRIFQVFLLLLGAGLTLFVEHILLPLLS